VIFITSLFISFFFASLFKINFMNRILCIAFSATVLLIACNQDGKTKSEDILMKEPGGAAPAVADTAAVSYEVNEVMLAAPPPPKQAPGDPEPAQEKQKSQPLVNSKPDWNKKIIKTADINIETKKYGDFSKKISEAASRFGGYIADEQQTETAYKIENVITLKVPVDQFQSAVDFLTTGGDKINEKKITSEDVTSQYVDTKSRLEAKRVARLRYLELLKQSRNMEEILQVQNEIDEIQEEIESAAGRINYLSNAAAMSTIHLTYYEVLNVSAKEDENPGFFRQVASAFETGWKGVGEVLVGLIYIWPLLLLVAGVIWYFQKRRLLKKVLVTSVKE
jgi:hypothetical protein